MRTGYEFNLNEVELSFISDYVDGMINAAKEENFKNPSNKKKLEVYEQLKQLKVELGELKRIFEREGEYQNMVAFNSRF